MKALVMARAARLALDQGYNGFHASLFDVSLVCNKSGVGADVRRTASVRIRLEQLPASFVPIHKTMFGKHDANDVWQKYRPTLSQPVPHEEQRTISNQATRICEKGPFSDNLEKLLLDRR